MCRRLQRRTTIKMKVDALQKAWRGVVALRRVARKLRIWIECTDVTPARRKKRWFASNEDGLMMVVEESMAHLRGRKKVDGSRTKETRIIEASQRLGTRARQPRRFEQPEEKKMTKKAL